MITDSGKNIHPKDIKWWCGGHKIQNFTEQDYLMAVGTSHKFTMIIFTQERGRRKPSWSKNTKAVLMRLQVVKHD